MEKVMIDAMNMITYNGKVIMPVPMSPSQECGQRPADKEVYLKEVNRWVLISYYHDGGPMEIELC